MKGSPERRGQTLRQPPLGLRRVSWVRVTFGQGPPRCAVAGVSHRRPVLRAVTFHTATQLVASGVPVVIRHLPSRRQTSPAGGAEAIAAGPPSRV